VFCAHFRPFIEHVQVDVQSLKYSETCVQRQFVNIDQNVHFFSMYTTCSYIVRVRWHRHRRRQRSQSTAKSDARERLQEVFLEITKIRSLFSARCLRTSASRQGKRRVCFSVPTVCSGWAPPWSAQAISPASCSPRQTILSSRKADARSLASRLVGLVPFDDPRRPVLA